MEHKSIVYKTLESPRKDCALPVELTGETIAERKEKVLLKMQENRKALIYLGIAAHQQPENAKYARALKEAQNIEDGQRAGLFSRIRRSR